MRKALHAFIAVALCTGCSGMALTPGLSCLQALDQQVLQQCHGVPVLFAGAVKCL